MTFATFAARQVFLMVIKLVQQIANESVESVRMFICMYVATRRNDNSFANRKVMFILSIG